MAFCNNCGSELPDGAKFCHVCGHEVGAANVGQTQRQQVFEGTIHKCPNCGESLASFMRNCPTCGFELRDVQSSNAVKEFAKKLEEIEDSRSSEKKGFFSFRRKSKSVIDQQKITAIQNFSIPNSREDLLEFMILATSNIDMSLFGTMDKNGTKEDVAKAWFSKVQQVYEKAKSSYGNETDLRRIEELYIECKRKIRKEKNKRFFKNFLLFAWLPLAWAILIASILISNSSKNKSEEVRLDNIVISIEEALEEKDYVLALRNAESIEYEGHDSERERWWTIKKQTMVDLVISEADEAGIHLEPSPTVALTEEPTSTPEEEQRKAD